jgi:hypothetical protein
MQSHQQQTPVSSLPGPARDSEGEPDMKKGASTQSKDARSMNGYLPIERYLSLSLFISQKAKSAKLRTYRKYAYCSPRLL